MNKIVISATGLYTPPFSISNEELVASFNEYVDYYNKTHPSLKEPLLYSSSDFILKASGIKNRYVVEKSGILDIHTMRPKIPKRDMEHSSLQCDMAVCAASDALKNAKISQDEIDMVIVACSNMERPYPAIAIEVQNALGIKGFGFDLNVACSSATFGIQVGYNALISKTAKGVLIVNPEICSAHLNFRDRDSHFIFGDAATAVILQNQNRCESDHPYAILSTQIKTAYSNNIRNNFGFLNVCDVHSRDRQDILFMQQGRKVFKEVIPMVTDLMLSHIEKSGLSTKALKRLWLHQANINMNQLIAKKLLDHDPETLESPSILEDYANTSSAGSIIVFHQFHSDLHPGDIGILCSFGAGYSIGSILLQKIR